MTELSFLLEDLIVLSIVLLLINVSFLVLLEGVSKVKISFLGTLLIKLILIYFFFVIFSSSKSILLDNFLSFLNMLVIFYLSVVLTSLNFLELKFLFTPKS